MLRINQTISDIPLKTTAGEFGTHDYYKDSWGLLVCYVSDFSAVCASELSRLASCYNEFKSRGVKILAMSCDPLETHLRWVEDVSKLCGINKTDEFPFPIVSDRNRMLSLYLNVLDSKTVDQDGVPVPCRATFVIAPDLSIQLIHFYPQTTGRNFDETLRSIDALKLSFDCNKDILTPCEWKPTKKCLISQSLSKDVIDEKYSNSTIVKLPSGKEYYRLYQQMENNRKFNRTIVILKLKMLKHKTI
ncbi:peroxiredoxin-6-like [Adelges cooleyi]|uniref:peroxiredoxin-6-like n=1 Tax=Adelges cooleyi TaxID=133065 RepID=UPI00217FEBC1|nr:peroxiredoxin-6-like [Adelges cooleyi]